MSKNKNDQFLCTTKKEAIKKLGEHRTVHAKLVRLMTKAIERFNTRPISRSSRGSNKTEGTEKFPN